MTEKIALFDLDGTLADYDYAMKRDLALIASHSDNPEPDIYNDYTPWLQTRMNLIKRQPGWWRNLPRIELGFKILDLAQNIGFTIHVLTKGPRTKSLAWSEKLEWCAEYLPNIDVTITSDKGLVYGRVLVDDYPSYMNRWLSNRPRGLGIMPRKLENSNYKHPQVILADSGDLPIVAAELKKAYERK